VRDPTGLRAALIRNNRPKDKNSRHEAKGDSGNSSSSGGKKQTKISYEVANRPQQLAR